MNTLDQDLIAWTKAKLRLSIYVPSDALLSAAEVRRRKNDLADAEANMLKHGIKLLNRPAAE